jgi:L-fucose isomerase-like protein
MHCTYTTFAASLHDPATLRPVVAPYEGLLRSLGAEPATAGAEAAADPLAVLVATGGTERAILELRATRPERPLLLVAHPGHNSLPAALEALARVHQLGGRGRVVYVAAPDDADSRAALTAALHEATVVARLRATRIGLVGSPSDWLVASSPDPEVVRRVWGPTVAPVPLDDLYARIPTASGATVPEARSASRVAVAPAALAEADRLHAALQALVDEAGYDAVSLRCFDVIGALGTTGCVALARLNDAGVVAGCEGDLVSTLGILWLRALVSELPWMANPARIDLSAGTLTLAHCTVPLHLVESYRLDTHFESGQGVGISGRFPTGPVTLVRIGGSDLDRLWLWDGELVGTGDDPHLCRTQVTVAVSPEALQELLDRPLGNHVLVVAGHHAAPARRWWETFVAPR